MLTLEAETVLLNHFTHNNSLTEGQIKRLAQGWLKNNLSKALDELVSLGILKRSIVRSSSLGRVEYSYSLTPKGERLVQLVYYNKTLGQV